MIKKYIVKRKVKQIVGEENLEFLKHSKNYLSATFFLKALGFISVPVFTRLLTPDEYGILSIFTSTVTIMTILLGLNLRGGIKRYYFEGNNDFDKALGSNLIFIVLFNIIMFIIIFFLKEKLASFFAVNQKVFILAVLTASFSISFKILLNYLQGIKDSRKYSCISIFRSSFVLILSIILMFWLEEKRYMGKVYAQLIITGAFSVYAYYFLSKTATFSFDWRYIKYTLVFGIPLIPHALSGFILSHFDRIIIQQLTNATNTGLYSFAYKVGMIMNVVVIATIKAWQPIFYEEFRAKNYNKINRMAYNYSKYICLAAIILILFAKEVIMILADKKYYVALDLVPIIVLGYVCVFLYTLFFQYASYRKKTELISLNTFIAGLINIGLNYWLIPEFGYMVAAYTTFVSYLSLFLLHYSNARFILKERVISLKTIIPNFVMLFLIGVFFVIIKSHIMQYWTLLIVKFVIIIIVIYYLFSNKSE